MDELYSGSATLILSASLDVANLASAWEAGIDKILDKLAAPEETTQKVL